MHPLPHPCPCHAAVFRSFGAIAELPLLAVRPELQRRNGLGGLLLAAVEHLLLQAGAQVRAGLMPACLWGRQAVSLGR